MTAPAIAAVTIGLAVAIVWHFRQSADPSGSSGEIADNARAASAAQAALVPAPAPAQGDDDAEQGSSTAPAGPGAASPVSVPPPSRSPLPGEIPVLPIAELIEALQKQAPAELVDGEKAFAAEGVDADWAPVAEAEILSRVAQMPDLALISMRAECRTTMCRLQVASPTGPGRGGRTFNILVDSVDLEPRWMVAILDSSGALHSVAYLWRQGMAPPRPAAEE